MRIEDKTYLDFSDVLIIPKRSTLKSRSEVDITREYNFLHSPIQFKGTGIIAANMDGVGEFNVASIMAKNQCMTALHKHHEVADLSEFYLSLNPTEIDHIFYSIGITEDDQMKLSQVNRLISIVNPTRLPNKIVIDVANGYTEKFIDFVKRFRDNNPTAVIMAGNVVTAEMAEQLILSGADIVKSGIGSGAQCTTRLVTGVGVPQFSCIVECADAVHGLGGHLCSDGGCITPGDVSKSLSAGADFVMLGSMLSGTDEGGGDIVTKRYITNEIDDTDKRIIEEKKFIQFYGMSSKTAQEKHNGGLKAYRSSEGRTTMVPYKGPLQDVIGDILGGVRSTGTYIGARRLKEYPKRATFIRVNNTHNTSYEHITIGR